MRNITLKFVVRFAGALLFVATVAFADTTVSMELIAPPDGPSMGGVYISPYTALIGAPGQTVPTINGVPTPVICDDFATDVSIYTPPWQAIVTGLSALQGEATANTKLKFDTSSATQQQFDYTVAAYLALEILQAQQANDTTKQGELSYALWGLFDTTSPFPLSGGFITGLNLTNASSDLSDAISHVSIAGLNPGNFEQKTGAAVMIYSPTPKSASQEYLSVSMAEPSEIALLMVDLLGVAGLVLGFRRRKLAACR